MLISGTIFGVSISNKDNTKSSSIGGDNHNSVYTVHVVRNENNIQVNTVKLAVA